MRAGNWSFQVRATDAAGNEAFQPLQASWTTAFTPGQPYARIMASGFIILLQYLSACA